MSQGPGAHDVFGLTTHTVPLFKVPTACRKITLLLGKVHRTF